MAPTTTSSNADHIALFQPQSEEAFASLHSPSNKGFLDPSTATTQISIRFSQRPRDPTRGFVFGRIESLCDVLLTGSGISRRHFYIALNPRNGTPVLQDVSSYGTIVESRVTGTGTTHVRRQSVAIFDKDVIQAGLIKFVVAIPHYPKQIRETYMRNVLASFPVLDGLRIQPDLHLTMQEQGKLSLMTDLEETPSRLQKAVDHRGDFYALKLRSKSDKSCWDKNILHPHLVKIFPEKFLDPNKEWLVIEWPTDATLAEQTLVSAHEMMIVLKQILGAMAYIHEHKIIHGGVEPSDI